MFIEQPELHLHPRAQAHLADLFIEVLTLREGGKERGIQLIIETHSEHFLYRLQRRIAECQAEHPISSSKVAAYFAHSTGSESTLEALRLDEYGNIANWPEDFLATACTIFLRCPKRQLADSRLSRGANERHRH